jgi:hypothetical protein
MMNVEIVSTPRPLFKFVKTNGRFARIHTLSASITPRLAPKTGAKSILLITSRSERVIPGPPLRGIFSPSATSITYIVKSANSGLNVAARLSPPDSMKHNYAFGNVVLKTSMAERFMDASSRMAV